MWYVDAAAGAGDGTAAAPFPALGDASAASGPGDHVFVYAGSYATGIVLQDGQQLTGQGIALDVNGERLVDPSTRPVVQNASGAGITLAADNTIRGLDVCITTSARTDEEGRALLEAFNFPFRQN